jgi:hypothetical protein
MRTGRGGAHAQIDDVRRVRAAELPRGVRLVTSYLHAATARSLSRCRSPRLRQRLDQRAPLRLVGRTDVGANPRARRVESAHPAYPPGTSIAVLGLHHPDFRDRCLPSRRQSASTATNGRQSVEIPPTTRSERVPHRRLRERRASPSVGRAFGRSLSRRLARCRKVIPKLRARTSAALPVS